MSVDINACTVFTTSLCNLNCDYCYIYKDKSGQLKKIDEDLEKDFANNQYIKQILDFDPNIANTLESVTLWGGEPFLHVERFTDHLEEWFKAFHTFYKIDTSTNFIAPNEIEKLQDLLIEIDKYYHGKEKFDFCLQLSIDGYEEFNDAGRGKGTTKKFLENFHKMFDIKYNDSKINLRVHTKPTWSRNLFHYLDTKEKCYKWYEFFAEEMFIPHQQSGAPWSFMAGLANVAGPTEHTKEDGIKYAQILRNTKLIQQEIWDKYPCWRDYPTLLQPASFFERYLHDCPACSLENHGKNFRGFRCAGHCGVFSNCIVPIPNNLYTMCHRGLFDGYVDYCNEVKEQTEIHDLSLRYFQDTDPKAFLYTKEEFQIMHDMMSQFFEPNQIQYTDLINFIREYAIAGLIDEKYQNMNEIEESLSMFLGNSYCVQDSYIFAGSWVTMSGLDIPLLYNGAADVAKEEFKRLMEKEGLIL